MQSRRGSLSCTDSDPPLTIPLVTAAQWVLAVVGLAIIVVVFYDLFQSVVLPRPAVRKVQLARGVVRPMWYVWRWVSQRTSRVDRSEGRLAAFAPIALLMLFAIWASALVLGYGLVLDGFAEEIRPAPPDLITSIYISASTLVPLAYGDFVPEGPVARILIVAESATGVGPAALGMRHELGAVFDEWRQWSSMVLESHLAYPLLVYFRSSHDNEAWVNSFGAVMDAAILVMSTVEDGAIGPARLMFTVGNHLVEDLSWVFRFKSASYPIVEQSEYVAAVALLTKAGYKVKDTEKGWKHFAQLRSKYAMTLNQMANLLALPPAQWIGDRSYLPHRERPSRASRRPRTTTTI